MKKILVIDAQGGGIGRQVVAELVKRNVPAEIIAVGTNSAATAQMMKAGAVHGATGENPVVVCSRTADLIIGPIGIVIGNYVAGLRDAGMKVYIEDAVRFAERQCAENAPEIC